MIEKRNSPRFGTLPSGLIASERISAPALLEGVRKELSRLPSNQKALAQLLLDDPEWLIKANVAEIAARGRVSPPTVVRFARKVGCGGLRDLKLKLAAALAIRSTQVHTITDVDSTSNFIVNNISDELSTVLVNWRNRSNPDILQQIADAVVDARQVMCVGAGAFSNFLAQELQAKLYQYGCKAISFADTRYQMVAAASLDSKDVFIAMSFSGQLPSLLRLAELAKSRGALVVAITKVDSPLTAYADVVVKIDAPSAAMANNGFEASVLQTVTVEALTRLVSQRRVADGGFIKGGHDYARSPEIFSGD